MIGVQKVTRKFMVENEWKDSLISSLLIFIRHSELLSQAVISPNKRNNKKKKKWKKEKKWWLLHNTASHKQLKQHSVSMKMAGPEMP